MPSPFPGMDPYLEGAAWGTLHFQFIAQMARLLVPQLVPKYAVETSERFVSVMPEDQSTEIQLVPPELSVVFPDISVAHNSTGSNTGSGVDIVPAPIEMMTIMPEAVPQFTLEIRDSEDRQLVTAIEFLSPTNKRGEGRTEYLNRRRKIMTGGVNLMEIDLLRGGKRVPMAGTLPSAAYFVFLTRARNQPMTGVWPIGLGQPLPVVPVPLLEGDPDAALDLQRAFRQVYDECGLAVLTKYRNSPSVPLSEEQQTWATNCLKAAGKLPA